MKIALYGATGAIGSRIAGEALERGHEVSAVVRDASRLVIEHPKLSVVQGDVTDPSGIARAVASHDAVVSAVGGVADGRPGLVVEAAHALVAGLLEAAVSRLIVVGGAGSLRATADTLVIELPDYPDAIRPVAEAQAAALEVYRAEGDALEWTFVSPPRMIAPGRRTGTYSLSLDDLLVDDNGLSHVSTEDFAVAIVDEVERARHPARRMAVAAATCTRFLAA